MGHAVVFITSYISYIFIIVLAGKTSRGEKIHFALNQLKQPEGIGSNKHPPGGDKAPPAGRHLDLWRKLHRIITPHKGIMEKYH